jgi:hypothetical protein
VIKYRRLRWVGQVERIEKKRGAYGILVGKPEGMRPLGRPRRSWMILRWIFKKKKAVWTGLIWLRAGIGGGLL